MTDVHKVMTIAVEIAKKDRIAPTLAVLQLTKTAKNDTSHATICGSSQSKNALQRTDF